MSVSEFFNRLKTNARTLLILRTRPISNGLLTVTMLISLVGDVVSRIDPFSPGRIATFEANFNNNRETQWTAMPVELFSIIIVMILCISRAHSLRLLFSLHQ